MEVDCCEHLLTRWSVEPDPSGGVARAISGDVVIPVNRHIQNVRNSGIRPEPRRFGDRETSIVRHYSAGTVGVAPCLTEIDRLSARCLSEHCDKSCENFLHEDS